MALHTQLPIYKVAYDFLDIITELARSMPRDFKQSIGGKHRIGARHYIRYVDDFILLHESPQWLNAAREQIEAFLADQLHARLNPAKTVLQPIARGIDFVGHVIRPWHRTTRPRTVGEAVRRVATLDAADLFETANSYFGLLRQASHSHHDRARLANALRRRGHCIAGNLTKTYRHLTQETT